MDILNEARSYFLGRRLFISTNYDDSFYCMLPLLIMLKADPRGNEKPNIFIYAPFPKKIEQLIGASMSPDDWKTALRSKWIHVVSRKNYHDPTWRNSGKSKLMQYCEDYDNITKLNGSHFVLPDDFFVECEEKAKSLCGDILSKLGEQPMIRFGQKLSEIEMSRPNSCSYLCPFTEIMDRSRNKKGYDGYLAAQKLIQYFLNDFKQAQVPGLEYTDLMMPPIYIDLARYIMGYSSEAITSEPQNPNPFTETELDDYLTNIGVQLGSSGFILAAIDSLVHLFEKGTANPPPSVSSLRERVKYFADNYRDAVWIILFLVSKISESALQGLSLTPHTFQWRERFMSRCLNKIFKRTRNHWAMKWSENIRQFSPPIPKCIQILKPILTFGQYHEPRSWKLYMELNQVIEETGMLFSDQKNEVSKLAKTAFINGVKSLTKEHLDIIYGIKGKWPNLYPSMEELKIPKSHLDFGKQLIWRNTGDDQNG